jgi:hypothetical protein
MGQTDFIPGEVTALGIETPLGQLRYRPDLAEGAHITIAVRPDDVDVNLDEAGNGRIVSQRFIGIATIYQVALPDGTRVHSWQPHHVRLAEGAAVRVTLSDDHSLPCFYQEQAVNIV